VKIGPRQIVPGDAILVSGDLGLHGVAVLSVREGLSFAGNIASDSAPLHRVVADLIAAGVEIHCLRDLTRGGLASALNEIASASGMKLSIDERAIPGQNEVQGACEVLGLDPLYVANEGRFVAFVPRADAERALTVMRNHAVAHKASLVGEVGSSGSSPVVLKTVLGTHRILDLLSGEQLPRIC
jgi:hydrogenase expression/formation protein HypE